MHADRGEARHPAGLLHVPSSGHLLSEQGPQGSNALSARLQFHHAESVMGSMDIEYW